MTHKDTTIYRKSRMKIENFAVFYKKYRFFFVVSEKCRTFAPANQKLGYGVMVTLHILVLSFLVRVRVPQQMNKTLQVLRLQGF